VDTYIRRLYNFHVKTSRRKTGDLGEEIASKFLERKGFKIVGRNYNKPWGEIDIVAEKDGIMRFVEVKSVSREIEEGVTREIDYRPEELIDGRKLRKLARTAALYMESKRDKREFQIDAIGVILDKRKRIARCRLFEQALEDNL
jgi:putative endonuclease